MSLHIRNAFLELSRILASDKLHNRNCVCGMLLAAYHHNSWYVKVKNSGFFESYFFSGMVKNSHAPFANGDKI